MGVAYATVLTHCRIEGEGEILELGEHGSQVHIRL